MTHIMDMIRTHSHTKQDHLALVWVDSHGIVKEKLTYQQLMSKVDQISSYFSEKGGLIRGDIVALLFLPGLDFILAFLACLQMGIIPVPLKIPANKKRVNTILPILNDCKPKFIISPHINEHIKNLPIAWLEYQSTYHTSSFVKPAKSDEIAFLQYTSGTTGDPKGVMISHHNLIHNFKLMKTYLNLRDDEITVSWLPHYHDMGLIGAYLAALYLGFSGYHMAPSSFMLNPNLFLQLISDKKGTNVQCPNAAYDWMSEKWDGRKIDLSSLHNVLNGSEPVQIDTLERFYETFKAQGLRKEAIRPTYGLAEATLFVTQAKTSHCTSFNGHVGCGICPEIDIRIVNPNSLRECAVGEEGEIWLRSDSNALGYYNKPTLTQEIFHAQIQGDQDFYLRTGDLGFIRDAQLFVTGRIKDMIIINGVNIYPQDIEHTVEQFKGMICSVAFDWQQGKDTKVVILAEVEKDNVPDINTLISFVLKHHSIPLFDLVLCAKGNLAKTTSGKIKRQANKQLYKENNLSIIKQMEKTWGLTEFIINTYQHDQAETFYELGFDSLTMTNLVFELEKIIPKNIKKDLSISQLYQMKINEFVAMINKNNIQEGQLALNSWYDRVNKKSKDRLNQIHQDAELFLPKQTNLLHYCDKTSIKHVLVSGATGFIGAFLLLKLLTMTDYHLHLLIRADTVQDGYDRLFKSLTKYHLLNDAKNHHLNDRITIHCGDLSKKELGLAPHEWNQLTELIDSIYHIGALTNYVKNYEELKQTNVEGTRSITELAWLKRLKYIHYVSTTFVFGWTTSKYVQENNSNKTYRNIDFGYSQSKWVAEQLIWQAQKYGIPIQIYRPAWVTASSSCVYTDDDIITRILTYMINHRVTIDIPNQISMMPVDKVAADIVALSLIKQPKHFAYHLTSEYANVPMIVSHLTEKYGYVFSYLSLQDFNYHLHTYAKPKDLLYPLVPFFNMHYPKIAKMASKLYSRTNYLSSLMETNAYSVKEYSYKEMTDFTIAYLQQRRLIPSWNP